MAKSKRSPEDEDLTVSRASVDLQRAYRVKSKLLAREKADFLFALGEQWSADDKRTLELAGIKPVVDNRIAPNIFLLTGLERQNRTDFKAFPIGDEDGLKAEIASMLFKDAIKKSNFSYKSSDQFKDGIICGESHLELYLDYTDSLINGKPCWQKLDGDALLVDPASREYDFSDARYVYKVKLDVSEDDLIALYPDKEKEIDECQGRKLDFSTMGGGDVHRQPKDYPVSGSVGADSAGLEEETYDLVERYYKKWVKRVFLGDKKTGEIRPVDSLAIAKDFVSQYKAGIESDLNLYQTAVMKQQHEATIASIQQQNAAQMASQVMPAPEAAGVSGPPVPAASGMVAPAGQPASPAAPVSLPPPPTQDPERFIVIERKVPEIWCFAFVPGMEEPLADERAWFFPKWKSYPFVPYFARFSTAPITGDDRHLLVQGVVYGVKGSQEKHNKAEMLMIRHLNSATNSGWLAEEDSWVDRDLVKQFGTSAGVNLEFRSGKQKPERIQPMLLSQGHAQISVESADAIKAQLGINADLLATQQGSTDSGRAIALRQKQGLLMVQELFDNLSRSRQLAGKLILSQLGEIYDTDSAKKVVGESFLRKNFPVMTMASEDPQQPPQPMKDEYGNPMQYDKEMADLLFTEILSGNLDTYDVSVGEAVASETQKMSVASEIKDIATAYPGLVPPDVLVRHSQLPESAKSEILSAMQQAQQAQQAQMAPPDSGMAPAGK